MVEDEGRRLLAIHEIIFDGSVSLATGCVSPIWPNQRVQNPPLTWHIQPVVCMYTPLYIYSFQVCRTQGLGEFVCVRWHYVLFTACGGCPRKGQLVQTNVSLPWQNIIKWEDVGQCRSFNKAERDASARFASIAAPKQQTSPPSRNHFLRWQLPSPLR